MILSVVLLSATNSCKPKVEFIPQNEIGEIDYYGPILNGTIPPEVFERIKEKEVEVVSKGLLYDYYLLKKYAKDNNIIYR